MSRQDDSRVPLAERLVALSERITKLDNALKRIVQDLGEVMKPSDAAEKNTEDESNANGQTN